MVCAMTLQRRSLIAWVSSVLAVISVSTSACGTKRRAAPAPRASHVSVVTPAPPTLRDRIWPVRPMDDREPAAQCQAALAAAEDAEQGVPGALQRLEALDDPLARALLALLWFHAGKTSDASEARHVLAERVPCADPAAPPLVQHLQYVQGTLDHCVDLKPLPDTVCELFAKDPREALLAFRGSESSRAELSASQIAHECVSRIRRAPTPQGDVLITKSLRGVPGAYFDAANAAKIRDPRAIEQAVFEALAIGLIQTEAVSAPSADTLARLEEAVARARPAFLPKLKQSPGMRAGRAIFSSGLLDSAHQAGLELAARPDPPDCNSLYYGIGVPRDFPAARRCYEQLDPGDSERARMLVVMLMNGQGGPRDLLGAQQILERADYRLIGHFMPVWNGMIAERLAEPQRAFPEVNYCDVGGTTLDMNECGSIQLTLAAQAADAETQQLRVWLELAAQKALDELRASALVARQKDGERVYFEHIDGTMRGMSSISHELYLLERQQLRLRRWLGDHSTDAQTPADLAEAERALARSLREHRAPARWTSIYGSPSPAPQQDASQRAWLAYREAWLHLLHTLPASGVPLLTERALRTVLTRERIEEIGAADEH